MSLPANRKVRSFADMRELVDFIWAAGTTPLRGYNVARQYTDSDVNHALANNTTNQAPFPATRDVFTLVAGRKYRFRGLIALGTGATTHVTNFGFIASGGLTVTSVRFLSIAHSGADDAIAPAQNKIHEAITPAAVTATSVEVETTIYVEGQIRVNVGGGLQPVIAFGTAPGGTNEVHPDSFFEFEDVGPSVETKAGNVS